MFTRSSNSNVTNGASRRAFQVSFDFAAADALVVDDAAAAAAATVVDR